MSDEETRSSEAADAIARLNADWERRKARVLRQMQETPLDRWLRWRR